MYELCLEYGTFPISLTADDATDLKSVPAFLAEDSEFVEKLHKMNDLFHSLFVEIEGDIDFIGRETPEKIENLRGLYNEIAEVVKDKYSHVRVEDFYL